MDELHCLKLELTAFGVSTQAFLAVRYERGAEAGSFTDSQYNGRKIQPSRLRLFKSHCTDVLIKAKS